jgi:hypothetical protein
MSLTEKMNDLLDEMKAVNAEIIEKTGGPAGSDTIVAHAPNADKLDGMSAGRVSDLLRERIRAHIETLGQNAHNLLPSDLGTYSDTEFNGKLDEYLDINGTGPLSFYGDREYLPPTVTGSFESGVNWAPWGFVGMFLEDNGTLMMLRTGTDGVKAGVYYSYLRNALNTRLISDIVMTNARYHPAYFPAGSVARSVLWSNQDLIIGILHNVATLQITGYFISLTNNTFDQSKHTGIVIPAGTIINPSITGEATLRGIPMGFLKDGTVYLLVNKDTANVRAAGMKVYSIPKQNLIDSNYVAPTPITGWTINRGVAGVVSRTDLDYADDKFDLIALTDGRMVPQEIDRANPPHYAKTLDTGVMWLSTGQFMSVWDNSQQAQYVQWLTNFAFVFDPVSKVVDMAQYFNSKPVVSFTSPTTWDVSDAPANPYLKNPGSHVGQYQGQDSVRVYLTENNVAFYYRTYVLYTNRVLGRATYPANADFSSIMRGSADYTDILADQYEGRFASPCSFLYTSVSNFGDLVLTGQNTGWNKSNKVQRMWFRAGTSSTFTYQYGSLQGYNFWGNPPTPDRAWLADYPGANKADLYNCVNETDESGWLVHQARYDNYVDPNRRSGSANINTAMVGSGAVSITPAAFNSLEASLRADLAANLIGPYGGGLNLWYEVVVPQRYTDMPAFVYGHYVGVDRITRFFVYSINVNVRGNVTSASLQPGSRRFIDCPHGYGTAFGISISTGDSGQVAIRRANGGFYVGLTTQARYTFIGNSVASCMLMQWTPGGGWSFPMGYDYDQQQISISGFLNMSHGLYLTFTTENHRGSIDCGTKLLGQLISNGGAPELPTLNHYRARMNDGGTTRIFLSQQTVTAWTVYFADPTPVMIDGLYYELGVYAHYLNGATDQNKTFYVWAVRLSGAVFYHVTTNPAIPTGFEGQLYLGYFTTNSAGLAVVAIEKRVAVGGTLISTTSRGKSIPVTAGVPNTPGRLSWK